MVVLGEGDWGHVHTRACKPGSLWRGRLARASGAALPGSVGSSGRARCRAIGERVLWGGKRLKHEVLGGEDEMQTLRGRPRGRLGPSGWGLGGWMRGRPRLRWRISAPAGGWSGGGAAGGAAGADVVRAGWRKRSRQWFPLPLWKGGGKVGGKGRKKGAKKQQRKGKKQMEGKAKFPSLCQLESFQQRDRNAPQRRVSFRTVTSLLCRHLGT